MTGLRLGLCLKTKIFGLGLEAQVLVVAARGLGLATQGRGAGLGLALSGFGFVPCGFINITEKHRDVNCARF